MKYTIKRLLGFVGKYKYPAILTIISGPPRALP